MTTADLTEFRRLVTADPWTFVALLFAILTGRHA